jgi:hypothetical protein
VIVANERVRALAEEKARELNMPWDAARVYVKRPLLGALLGTWRVTSISTEAGSEVVAVVLVNERTATATPVRARYHRGGGSGGGSATFFGGQLVVGVLVGVLVFVATTRLLGLSTILGAVSAIAWALLAMVYTVRFRRL